MGLRNVIVPVSGGEYHCKIVEEFVVRTERQPHLESFTC